MVAPRVIESWTLRLDDQTRTRLAFALMHGAVLAVERLDDGTVRIEVRAAKDDTTTEADA